MQSFFMDKLRFECTVCQLFVQGALKFRIYGPIHKYVPLGYFNVTLHGYKPCLALATIALIVYAYQYII